MVQCRHCRHCRSISLHSTGGFGNWNQSPNLIDRETARKLMPGIMGRLIGVNVSNTLKALGLADIDVDLCEVSHYWKEQYVELIEKYEGVFSRDKLDCGEVKEFVHHIHLTDDKPFRLPYRRVPPGHYHKLRQLLK